eukprot:scaffold1226_cov102-Skeletonema_marinoi.AAC.2
MMAASPPYSPHDDRRRRALLSWRLDVTSSTAVILLLFCWLSDMNQQSKSKIAAEDDSLLLSKSFLENGFCLAPHLFDNTHFSCASFDFLCAFVCILAILVGNDVIPDNRSNNDEKQKKKSMILPGSAIYFLAHSYGHYTFSSVYSGNGNEQQFTISETETISTNTIKDTIILAFILSIGPLEAASTLIKSNKLSPPNAYIMAAAMLSTLVGIYHTFLQSNPSYALLYINISIILSMSLPKLLFVGCTSQQDVILRSNEVILPKLMSGFLALDVVMAVVMEGSKRSGGVDNDDVVEVEEMKKVKAS